ncbi:MAG: prephenate dehydrogenase/arogenate dehydrogenase family protein, partial [Candidatus Latescibacteria bacterium]|nr:prephenate dehydrogenase/arogenate dehydrogenase family protein [Candidatus Latescibacterota bacterium]
MNITIIGLGLLGGSFGLAIRQAQAANRVIGIDLNQEIIDRACERGAIDEGHLDSVEAVREADLVVLAMPVRTIIDTVSALADCLSEKTILFDLGSTKAAISRKIAALPIAVRYIGGHPMAGTEQAGIDAAAAGMFSGAPFALVP